MTRVAILSVHACPLARLGERDAGGMNVYLRYLARELGRQGALVDIFTRHHNQSDPRVMQLHQGARLIHIDAGPSAISKAEIASHLAQFGENVRRFIRDERISYDLVHTHYWLSGSVGMALAREWGVPHITTFHTLAEVKLRARAGETEHPIRRCIERNVTEAADAIVALGCHEKEALKRLYDASPDRVHVIPAGVDTSLFRPMDRRLARSILGLDGGPVVLSVGRPDPIKGVELLLQAVAALEEQHHVTTIVVGGDPDMDQETARLRTLAAELGIGGQVLFRGPMPQEQLPLYYNAADVVVLPSYYESFGLVALEAMACGTPVVASRVGGLAVLVKDGETGYLVPWHCPEPFALRLEVLLSQKSLKESMGQAGRSYAVTMGWDRMGARMVSLYRTLLERRRAVTGQRA